MILIPAREVLDFLSQAAPRAWLKRMIPSMVEADELHAYVTSGTVRSHVSAIEYLSQIPDYKLEDPSEQRDKLVREVFDDEIADKVRDKKWNERFLEYEIDVVDEEDNRRISPGWLTYSDIDWDNGTLTPIYIPDARERLDHLWWDQEELLASEFNLPDISAEFGGLSFVFEQVELLLPTHRLERSAGRLAPDANERRATGRPRKWDWEGAMAIISGTAKERGLLTGEPGMQAKIESAMSQWFIDQTGDAPTISQIRSRASRLVQMVEKSKKDD